MILNLYRTISQLKHYLAKLQYSRIRMAAYLLASILLGIFLSNSPRAADLPILTVTAVLFGFTINAVVMLGNSSEHYLSGDGKHSEQLESYYKKSLYIAIHTLGIGIVIIILTAFYQLFPNFDINLVQFQFLNRGVTVELVGTLVYSLLVYYLIVFTIVIASAAELVIIRV